jgi:hypothetical protein
LCGRAGRGDSRNRPAANRTDVSWEVDFAYMTKMTVASTPAISLPKGGGMILTAAIAILRALHHS